MKKESNFMEKVIPQIHGHNPLFRARVNWQLVSPTREELAADNSKVPRP